MDFVAALGTAALSSLINTAVIVVLYTFWIIPRIVEKVRDELMDKIVGWVGDLKQNIGETIAEQVGEAGEKIRRTLSGKRANAARQVKLAEAFLNSNLPDDDDDSAEAADLRDDVIGEAVGKFGGRIINALLSRKSEEAAESTQDGVIKW